MQPTQLAQAQAQIDQDEIDHDRYEAKKKDVEHKIKEMLLHDHVDQLDKYLQQNSAFCLPEWASVQYLEGGAFAHAVAEVFIFKTSSYIQVADVAANLVEAFDIDAMIEEEQNND